MFSTVTSAFFSSSLTISSPRGDLRLSVIDFLLALNWWKYQGSSSGWPGRKRLPGSPVFGFSILTTSAPSQASASVQDQHLQTGSRMKLRQGEQAADHAGEPARCCERIVNPEAAKGAVVRHVF